MLATCSTPTAIDEPSPFGQFGCSAIETGSPASPEVTCAASAPTTTTIGAHPASFAAATTRLTNGSPRKMASCFGCPKRVEPPAASTTAATFIEPLCGISAGDGCSGVNIGRAFSEKAADATRQCRRNFGDKRERYFLRRFTADVQSGGREQIVEGTTEIEDRIFAELRQNLGMTFFWSE